MANPNSLTWAWSRRSGPLDQINTYIGTPGYMPPPNEPSGTVAADIYALRLCLYVPYSGKQPAQFPDLSTTLVDTPDPTEFLALNAIVLKACQPVLADRYHTAAELRNALKALLQKVNSASRERGSAPAFLRLVGRAVPSAPRTWLDGRPETRIQQSRRIQNVFPGGRLPSPPPAERGERDRDRERGSLAFPAQSPFLKPTESFRLNPHQHLKKHHALTLPKNISKIPLAKKPNCYYYSNRIKNEARYGRKHSILDRRTHPRRTGLRL